MDHRKWKESKQQPSMLPFLAEPGCCLIYFHFLWAIHPIRPVLHPLTPHRREWVLLRSVLCSALACMVQFQRRRRWQGPPRSAGAPSVSSSFCRRRRDCRCERRWLVGRTGGKRHAHKPQHNPTYATHNFVGARTHPTSMTKFRGGMSAQK